MNTIGAEIHQSEFFRDLLRSARDFALADAEGFQGVVHALELIGQQRTGRVSGLGDYEHELSALAHKSSLSNDIPLRSPGYHTRFCTLYKELRRARNDAVHQGAYARILTDHAVELAIILEDALMTDAFLVSQFMVRDVVEAQPWHPVSFVRQQMLKHAFSYLPTRINDRWRLIPEYSIARYLRGAGSQGIRKDRLLTHVSEAMQAGMQLLETNPVAPQTPISEILPLISAEPILVVDPDREDVLMGLLTASDIL